MTFKVLVQHGSEEHGDFEKRALKSCAFWLYHMLVVMDVFERHGPICFAKSGEKLVINQQCMDSYLFCEVAANAWVDAAPVSSGTIGGWTKVLLKRMGSQPWGFSAHRSRWVTRACILAILESHGKELPSGRLDIIIDGTGGSVSRERRQ